MHAYTCVLTIPCNFVDFRALRGGKRRLSIEQLQPMERNYRAPSRNCLLITFPA